MFVVPTQSVGEGSCNDSEQKWTAYFMTVRGYAKEAWDLRAVTFV